MILNLDKGFLPYGDENTLAYEYFTFSGGEPHIKISQPETRPEEVTITCRISSFTDLGKLLVAVDALRRMQASTIHAFIPYFPAARQDRVMVSGEPLTVKVYADLINNLHLASVTILDPHSDVTPALLNNCRVISNLTFIKEVVKELPKDLLLISPDAGALKKVYKLAEELENYEVVECGKVRNVKTGKLSGFKVHKNDLNGRPCLIADDICDGGGTFLGLAGALKEKNAGNLYLAVTHGIFSKGMESLAHSFDKIYTTDSFSTLKDHDSLKQLSLSELFAINNVSK